MVQFKANTIFFVACLFDGVQKCTFFQKTLTLMSRSFGQTLFCNLLCDHIILKSPDIIVLCVSSSLSSSNTFTSIVYFHLPSISIFIFILNLLTFFKGALLNIISV